jgi:hypothetical protein
MRYSKMLTFRKRRCRNNPRRSNTPPRLTSASSKCGLFANVVTINDQLSRSRESYRGGAVDIIREQVGHCFKGRRQAQFRFHPRLGRCRRAPTGSSGLRRRQGRRSAARKRKIHSCAPTCRRSRGRALDDAAAADREQRFADKGELVRREEVGDVTGGVAGFVDDAAGECP